MITNLSSELASIWRGLSRSVSSVSSHVTRQRYNSLPHSVLALLQRPEEVQIDPFRPKTHTLAVCRPSSIREGFAFKTHSP
jgi:hypothetical protein